MVAITSEETEIEVLQCSVENTISLQDSDGDIDQEEEEEEEEDEEPVTLGFVEKPKNLNSLLPQFFPSNAGGTPLPRSNAYYSSEPPKLAKISRSPGFGAALCNWCGTWKGDKICSSCWSARYCSEKHQAVHWRSGHKQACKHINVPSQLSESSTSKGKTTSNQVVASNSLWPEFEIFNEDEADYEYDTEISENNYSSSLVVKEQKDASVEAMMGDFEGDDDRRSWTSFQVRVGKAPEQVLRYTQDSKAKPLWPMASGRPSKILPQLLYFFGVKNDVDSLDWATIAVYTCADSCETSVAYKEEFAWVQLNSQTTTPP
ncbi:hypothetical protein MKX01_002700 [Papaver californicum]|nr:hypothetical protein MKX01_002700 [Papaver californicum]